METTKVAERYLSHLFGAILSLTGMGPLIVWASKRFLPAEKDGWFEVNHLSLSLPRLPAEFDGYKLVQISDFHIGTYLDKGRLDQVIDRVNQQQPDLVAITGDFVTFTPERYAADLVSALRQIKARDGVVAILGNHDHWTDPLLIREILRLSGVIELSNTVRTLRRGEACLHIAGVDDFMNRLSRLDRVLAQLPEQGAAILLAHEPDYADISAAARRFDLQLSGHSHGGQVRLPYLGSPFLPSYARKYPRGLYQVQQMWLYTNRGLGTAELQLRINCPAEVTVFHLRHPTARPDSF